MSENPEIEDILRVARTSKKQFEVGGKKSQGTKHHVKLVVNLLGQQGIGKTMEN